MNIKLNKAPTQNMFSMNTLKHRLLCSFPKLGLLHCMKISFLKSWQPRKSYPLFLSSVSPLQSNPPDPHTSRPGLFTVFPLDFPRLSYLSYYQLLTVTSTDSPLHHSLQVTIIYSIQPLSSFSPSAVTRRSPSSSLQAGWGNGCQLVKSKEHLYTFSPNYKKS